MPKLLHSIHHTTKGVSVEIVGVVSVCRNCGWPIQHDFFGWLHTLNGGFSWCSMHDDSEAKAEPAVAA